METEEKRLKVGPFAAHSARGVIRDSGTRRKVMLATLILAVAMAVLGSTLLAPALDYHERPGWFIFFWVICGWVTLTTLLLALFDLLMLRAEARATKRELARKVREDER